MRGGDGEGAAKMENRQKAKPSRNSSTPKGRVELQEAGWKPWGAETDKATGRSS